MLFGKRYVFHLSGSTYLQISIKMTNSTNAHIGSFGSVAGTEDENDTADSK